MKIDFNEKMVVLTPSDFEKKAAAACAKVIKKHPPKNRQEFIDALNVCTEIFDAIDMEIFGNEKETEKKGGEENGRK